MTFCGRLLAIIATGGVIAVHTLHERTNKVAKLRNTSDEGKYNIQDRYFGCVTDTVPLWFPSPQVERMNVLGLFTFFCMQTNTAFQHTLLFLPACFCACARVYIYFNITFTSRLPSLQNSSLSTPVRSSRGDRCLVFSHPVSLLPFGRVHCSALHSSSLLIVLCLITLAPSPRHTWQRNPFRFNRESNPRMFANRLNNYTRGL